ncbi:unnamed protein product [Peronospora belbahrii]|uniref:Uncharacterized protein n=1 Tax=Peronospora belbahrii TaxID=622444 RepID=A0AAU9LEC2_9STRA|nr:unnamed protein product [Peronospora belbahrii]CAH0518061.1 unnamed protein product [Peronospora belbahrii]
MPALTAPGTTKPIPTKSEMNQPTPAPTTLRSENPTPCSTTPGPTKPISTTSEMQKPEINIATGMTYDDIYSIQQQTELNHATTALRIEPLATSFAATTAASYPSLSSKNGGGCGLPATAHVGILASVCVGVTLTGFSAHKMRQQRSYDVNVPLGGYYVQPITKISHSLSCRRTEGLYM